MKLGYLLASLNVVNAQKSAILSEWSQWSQCDAPCGGGQMRRERECLIANFRRCAKQGELVEVEECNTLECTGDPYWSKWSETNKCSETCGGGTQSRFRFCIGGEPGDVGCEGLVQEVSPCATELCPGDICADSFFDVAILVEANAAALSFEEAIKSFLKNLVGSYKAISPNDARICLMRFSSWPEILKTFDEITNYEEAIEAIEAVPFYGKEADLGAALNALQDECFDLATGWRGTETNNNGVPSQTIVLTATNNTIEQIETLRLKKKSQRIFVVNIADSKIENVEALASDPLDENYFQNPSLEILAEEIVARQCSNELFPDQCYSNSGKGSCDGDCFTQYNGARCTCPEGTFLLGDGASCEDIDECAAGTHDCLEHQTCSNSFGSFRCGTIMHDCPAGFSCSHGCGGGAIGGALSMFEMEIGQSSPCSCPFGMVLGPDKLNCIDQTIPIFLLDECKNNNGGCSHFCRDLDDGFVCECPAELELSDDGLSCVSVCYSCESAADLSDCQETERCDSSATPCVTKVASGLISKGCESTERCIKDGSDKPVNFWTSPKCDGDSCDCCCYDSFCNTGADCAAARSPLLACPERPQSDLFSISCTGNYVGDVCSYNCGDGLSPNTPGLLSCSVDESSGEAIWMGKVPTACIDVDECLVENGKCQQHCVNRPSGFKCECYDNYDPQSDAKYDLVFVVDRSDTTPEEYLEAYKKFMRTVVTDRPVGDDNVRVGILTFASDVAFEVNLEDSNSQGEILNAIDNLRIHGSGRKTANAINFLLDKVDREGREHIPMVSILLTSGISDEDRLKVILAGWRVQAATWCNAYSLGVGPFISEEEMFLLSGDLQHYQLVSSPDLLSDVASRPPLDEYLDIFFPGSYSLLADGISCNIDECSTDLHGCSYQCQDFPNGYRCLCQPGSILGQDGKTCDIDWCQTVTCEYGCVSRNATFNCICPQGKQLSADGLTCEDLDECRQFNGGCSHTCENTSPSYKCTCPDGMIISQDMRTCKINICLQNNCEQGCSIQDGACHCFPGYYLADDGRTCEKFNRCHLDNGGCEFNCVADANFNFHCECPEGLNLRPDQKTCGVACYSCSWAESEDECNQNGQITCPAGDNACQVELRRINGVQYISKGCKQPEACLSNYGQNWAQTGIDGLTQCNQQDDSTCHYCCFSHLCNAGFDFSLAIYFLPVCPIEFPLLGFETFGGDENGVKIGGMVKKECPRGTFSSSRSQAMCNWGYDQKTAQISAFWSSSISSESECEDVDECENNPCSQECLNLYGSYRCYCQRDRDQSCSKQKIALLFVIQANSAGFNWFKDFAKHVIEPLNFPEARIGVITFGKEASVNVALEAGQNKGEIFGKLRGAPALSSSENNIGNAVDFAASYLNGQNIPASFTKRVVLLSEESSSDEIMPNRIKAEADSIYVVGTSNASHKQLEVLTENVMLLNDYQALRSVISDELLEGVCGGSSSYKAYGGICEKDECAENNGGCAGICHNTHGSFHCSCTNGLVLAADGRNCVEDFCRNHQCSHQCENRVDGASCSCPESMTIGADGRNCVDIDECAVENGGCESVCVNTDPWYQCACPDALLAQDQRSCIPDPCQNISCNIPGQSCFGNHDGSYQCRCPDGYRHNGYLGICEDIDECFYGNYCQYGCENLQGSYRCTCPDGKVLRDDGRTCGIVCYSCINAATNEECNLNSEVCTPEADSCQNEIRIHSGVKRITKRCKQGLACHNNYRQNPPSYLLDYFAQPQSQHQCNGGTANSVCRCCCSGNHCNWAEKPCTGRYDCAAAEFDKLVFLVDGSNNIKLRSFNEIASSIASIKDDFAGSSVEISTVLFSKEGTVSVEELSEDVFNGDLTGSTQTSVDFINNQLASSSQRTKIILITNTEDSEDLKIPAGFATNEIYAIGVGNVARDSLSLIAADDENVYALNSASELGQIEIDIKSKVCRVADFCSLADCSHTCYSDDERAYCTCPDDLILDTDFKTCVSATRSTGANLCSINNGGCQHRCVFDGPGHHCECEAGYRLDDNYRGCHDVDECMINNGDCSDRCVNTLGAHQCLCSNWAEERLSDDGRSCVPICDRGFSYFGHACWRIQGTFDFFDAKKSCSSVGAHLAILKDQNHLRAVVDNLKSWEEENGSLVGAKYWVGLFRSSDRIPFIPPGNWTWINGLGEGVQNLQLDLDDALNNSDGRWANAVFQNFIWGSEDPIKVQLDCMEHIKHTKAYRPTYTAEQNVLAATIDEVYDKFGGRRNYIDDRYPTRSRRDLTYGNPCGAPRTACGSAYSYNGKPTLSAEPCWKPLNYICQKTLSESFLQYQNVWDSGAILNLYMSSDVDQVTLDFPIPVKLNVWHGFSSQAGFAKTHVLTQRVNGNHYEKHSGKGILSFAVELERDSLLKLNLDDIVIN